MVFDSVCYSIEFAVILIYGVNVICINKGFLVFLSTTHSCLCCLCFRLAHMHIAVLFYCVFFPSNKYLEGFTT